MEYELLDQAYEQLGLLLLQAEEWCGIKIRISPLVIENLLRDVFSFPN